MSWKTQQTFRLMIVGLPQFASPQLYFTCHLRPANGRQPKARRTYGEDNIPVELVFFSTFEELALSGSDPMKSTSRGVAKSVSYTHLTLPTKRIV